MSKILIVGFMLAGLLAIVVMVVSCGPETPTDKTGIEIDIDRKKTRAPLKPAKPAPAPKTKKASKQ